MRLPNQAAIDANNLLHVSLLHTDITKAAFVPALAEALPAVQLVGDSLTRLTYSLRPAATWDDGQPVLAQDILFTLKLMFCPGLPNEAARNQYRFIRNILPDPANARRFVVECRGQAPEYVQASGDFFILPEHVLDPRGWLRRLSLAQLRNPPPGPAPDTALQAVAQRYRAETALGHLPGCGPYQLVKWEKDHYLSFRRKAHWWADLLRPAPLVLQARPRRLTYAVIPNAASATLALQRGELDLYPQMPAPEFARLQASPTARKKLTFHSTPSYDVVVAGFNTRHSTLADAPTRRALGQLFDAAGLLRATQLGSGQRTVGIISPSDSANYNDTLTPLPFSPEGGAALLRQAGWQQSNVPEPGWFRRGPNGARERLRLVLRYRAEEALFATIALQFQSVAAKLGIPVVLQPTEAGAFTMALHGGDFDMYVRTLRGNPFMFNFVPILHSLGVGEDNTTGFSTPGSDHLIEAIAAAGTKTRRAQLLRQFQALLQREMPLVPLFFLPNRVVVSRRLRGVYVGSIKPGYSVAAASPLASQPPN
ncbi:ABC transporter substrate-binding protein [Hymenobacter rubidus]|uniref:ABC transporter substrate-binding protein n=1 Tax=Hymenobacter rubidus TaxID=1441626 RepID=UPI00191DC071|nr:ABC transporter substrate-binding protein [Hymenobacter rubidus]